MQIDPKKLAQYRSYKDLPPVAGLCSVAEAARTGLGIKACVDRLKRYHYAFKRLHQIFTARITAEPIMELKTAFSLHAYLCAEHVAALRDRVAEMREPPLGLDVVPDENLRLFFDEILAADTTAELVAGLYGTALPALRSAVERHIQDTNPLVDQPSIRVCRFALMELEDMIDFGGQAIEKLVDPGADADMQPWLKLLRTALAATGGLDGADAIQAAELEPMRSARPYRYDP
ncbi:MAG: hypothetical protein OER86_14375, partial [Phycisphaerae bacterium]|nr:hypothetical protein [Phycisphaerae bacterium]